MKSPTEAGQRAMEVNPYTRLVSLSVHSENIFHFPAGLPAFENVKEYIFLLKPDTLPFIFMKALEPADLSFVCVDPFLIYPGYSPRLSEADISFLHIDKPEDLLMLSIVTVARNRNNTTANLQAPIVVNFQAALGKQVICDNQHYPIRYHIMDGLDISKKESQSAMAEATV
jgi:flagellar assembly factor FliW